MAGSESYVQVPADSTGKKMRTVHETIGSDDVHNEGVVVCDPTTTSQVLAVDSNGKIGVSSLPALATGSNAIGKLAANSGVDIGDVTLTAGTAAIGKLAANSGVDIGDVTLTAGTNAIGKLAANTGVDIGDVDVTSQVPGTGATNLGKAEDAAHSSGDVGVEMLGVRNDTPTSRAGTDGDYTPLAVDEYGHAKVIIVNNTIDATAWKYADINESTSGDNTVVAAQGAGNKIAVWSYVIVSDGTVDFRWEDGAGGTAFSGQIPLQAREGVSAQGGVVPLFVGTANTLLNLELSAAVNVHGHVSYTVVK